MRTCELNSGHSRRDILKAAVLGLGATVPGLASRVSVPHLQFPSEPRQRLSITSYPFRTLIESSTNPGRDRSKPGIDLKEFPRMVAERFGVHNINPLADHLSSTEPTYLEAFRKAVDAAQCHLIDLGIGGREFSSPDKSVRDAAVLFGGKAIDLAWVIGSPSIRQHLKGTPGKASSVDNAADSLARLADYGGSKNVIVNLENDSPGAEDPFLIVDIVAKVNSPFLRTCPDFGNSLRGHDAAYNQRALEALFHYAYGVCHVKDVLVSKDGHVDKVDVPGMFAIARATSYRGYFSMEYDTAAGAPFQGTESLVNQSLACLA